MKVYKHEVEEAIASLKELLVPGDTITCVSRHTSASGMTRHIDFYCFKDNQQIYLSGYMSKALGLRRAKRQGLVISGCGMDMGFATVYDLGRTLWPNGNGIYTRNRNGDPSPEKDGGYLLTSTWL